MLKPVYCLEFVIYSENIVNIVLLKNKNKKRRWRDI